MIFPAPAFRPIKPVSPPARFLINCLLSASSLLSIGAWSNGALAGMPSQDSIDLNNEGVKALKDKQFDLAIDKFKQAYRRSPGYKLTLENLGIAYKGLALSKANEPELSLRDLHMAIWLDPTNKSSRENLDSTIKKLGKDTSKFEDRVKLAENAVKYADFAGGIIEYNEALKIKDNEAVRKKLLELKVPFEWQEFDANKLAFSPPGKKPEISAAPDVDFGPYMADLQRRIKRKWFPPRGQESKRARVRFKVQHDGQMSNLELDVPSGDEGADQASLAAVKDASPFRPLPVGAPSFVDIQFTFDYNVFNGGRKKDSEAQLKAILEGYVKDYKYTEQARTMRQLAQLYSRENRGSDAQDMYLKALALLEEKRCDKILEAEINHELGDFFFQKDRFSDAVAYYRAAADIHKSFGLLTAEAASRIQLGLSILSRSQESSQEAKAAFVQAEFGAASSNDPQLLLKCKKGLAECFRREGDSKQALPLYKAVYEMSPSGYEGPLKDAHFEAAKNLADCLYRLNRADEALPLYKRCLELAPGVKIEPDALANMRQRVDELSHKLGIDTEEDTARKELALSKLNKAYSWLPWAFGGALLALLVIYATGRKQGSSLDLSGKGSGSQPSNSKDS